MKAPLLFLAVIVATTMVAIAARADDKSPVPHEPAHAVRLPVEGALPSLAGATGWLNALPLTPESLHGKVVLVDFWTYTCINWQRSLPYVRAWAEKYKEQGLVVIGVHTPEFRFEHNVDNVRTAVKALRVDYPVAIDSDYAIWRAFGNQYWPALYVVDAQGHIRHRQFGEGDYDRAEKVMQHLLTEAGSARVSRELVQAEARGAEVAADWENLRSPETYLGRDRTQGFTSAGGAILGTSRLYTAPARLPRNRWALAGAWTVQTDAVVLEKANGRLVYRFHARDLHLVMGPVARGSTVRFRVFLDGQPAGAAHGADVDEQGYGTVTDQRLYQLIRQPPPIMERQFEIEFLDPGVEAFAFTFG